MKNICIFCLLCFVLNFPLLAQDTCTDEGVEVSISQVVWDASAADLNPLLDIPFYGEVPTESFHIVHLDFAISADFELNGYEFIFDLSVTRSDKPVVLLFPSELLIDETTTGLGLFFVIPLLDNDMIITGFQLQRADFTTLGGVATSAGLMVRQSALGALCIDISLENRLSMSLDDTTCQLPDEVVRPCRRRTLNPINLFPIFIGWRIAQSPQSEVNIYPIPAQDNVFVDVYNSEINNLQIIDIQGKTQEHQASIRYGTDQIQINTARLENGIYWLKMETSDGVICRKIVVQR